MSSPVTSLDNEVAKRLRKLARRRDGGAVLLEGPRVVTEAIAAGVELDVLAIREDVDFDAPARRRVVLARRVFDSVAATETPQGVLAVAHAAPRSLADALSAARGAGWPLVVLDGVQDPGNVGAIARTAAATGAPAIAVLPGTADPYGPKAVRASAGNVFRLATAHATWDDLDGLRLLGADAGGEPLATADLAVDGLVLGSEAHGLRRRLPTVAIPMARGVESLNVAAAAAILLFEIARRKAA